MAKKEKQVALEVGLWNACNKLRGSVNATDYVNVVLGLLFLRFSYDKFKAKKDEILANPDTKDFAENPRFYSRDNVFFLEEDDEKDIHDTWEYIKNHSKATNILSIVDKALINIEKNNPSLRGALDIGYYPTLHLEPSKFSSLIDEIAKIQYSQNEADDVIGRVYEYFLRKFCIKAKEENGEFYTPGNIVDLMTQIIEPYHGSVYDPCCGSGGMFVQSAKFIEKHKGNRKDITIYGQEYNPRTYKLARMNLAIRGLACNLGDIDASSFTRDKHKGLKADFILANPPFNQDSWYDDDLKNDSRWKGYEIPPATNGNYAWILHMLSHLSEGGTGAFLLANGALSAGDACEEVEWRIRKQLIINNKVEAIIILPRGMFYSTDLSVTLWIIAHDRSGKKILRDGQEIQLRDRRNNILFIDARTLGDGGKNDDGYVWLTQEAKDKIKNCLFKWQTINWKKEDDIDEFCYSASLDEIEKKHFSLVPSDYIKFIDHDLEIDYPKEMKRIQKEIKNLLIDERESQRALEDAFEGIGYGVK